MLLCLSMLCCLVIPGEVAFRGTSLCGGQSCNNVFICCSGSLDLSQTFFAREKIRRKLGSIEYLEESETGPAGTCFWQICRLAC